MTETARTFGLVKWFNSKVGYGFITELSDDKKDIFVHYSAINVTDSQYKYLVQGEYVEFDLVKSTNDKHEFQAINISGIKGGPILCETRRLSASIDNGDQEDSAPVPRRRPVSRKPRTARPPVEQDGFTTVENKPKRKPQVKKAPVSA